METPTAQGVALLNSCLQAITEDGSDFFEIAKATGARHGDVIYALYILEDDGLISSFGSGRSRYKRRAESRPPQPDFQLCAGMPWCDQCDCYHYASAPCVDEIVYCKRCGEHHTNFVCAAAR